MCVCFFERGECKRGLLLFFLLLIVERVRSLRDGRRIEERTIRGVVLSILITSKTQRQRFSTATTQIYKERTYGRRRFRAIDAVRRRLSLAADSLVFARHRHLPEHSKTNQTAADHVVHLRRHRFEHVGTFSFTFYARETCF